MHFLQPRSHPALAASLYDRYHRIKGMLLNAAAGSAASALKELAFETALAAKHLKVTVLRGRVRLLLNHALCRGASWSATGNTASSAHKLPVSNPRLLPTMRTCRLPCSTRQKAWLRRCTSPCISRAATSPSFREFTKNTIKPWHAGCARAAATSRSMSWSSSSCRTTARRCCSVCGLCSLPHPPPARRSSPSHPPHRPACSIAPHPPHMVVSEVMAVPCCKQRALEICLSCRASAAAALLP